MIVIMKPYDHGSDHSLISSALKRKGFQDHFQELIRFELFWIFRYIKCALFPSYQISMSVLRKPVHVIKTLIVATVTVLIAVRVNKDLLEMV